MASVVLIGMVTLEETWQFGLGCAQLYQVVDDGGAVFRGVQFRAVADQALEHLNVSCLANVVYNFSLDKVSPWRAASKTGSSILYA